MKTLKIALISALMVLGNSIYAQQVSNEKFGNTLNLGAGIGYYGYLGRALPVIGINYELDVVRNFTLAPFTGIYSYRNDYYWVITR